MLKGFLPSLKEKINQRLRHLKQKRSKSKEEITKEEITQVIDIGTLPSLHHEYDPTERNKELISFLEKVIVTVNFVFIALLVTNHFLYGYLKQVKSEQDSLVSQIQAYNDTEKTALYVDKKTTYYKEVLDSKKILSSKLSYVLEGINPGITLQGALVKDSNFEIQARGVSAYVFTKLISDYLQGKQVSEIVLRSAALDPETKEYSVYMGGSFK